MKIYELALTPGLRSPFLPADELHPDSAEKKDTEKPDTEKPGTEKPPDNAAPAPAAEDKKPAATDKKPADAGKKPDTNDTTKATGKGEKKPPEVKIEFADLDARLDEVPVPPGNYDSLDATDKRLCWTNTSFVPEPKAALQCLDIANKGDEPETVLADVKGYEISLDRKKMLVLKGDQLLRLRFRREGSRSV